MTDLTREQIEEARDAILDSINATEQEFACNKAQHDLLGVRRREFLNALCDMALRAAKPEHPVDYSWVCNECGSYEFTMAVSEDDLSALACSGCGCDEFHKEEFKHDCDENCKTTGNAMGWIRGRTNGC